MAIEVGQSITKTYNGRGSNVLLVIDWGDSLPNASRDHNERIIDEICAERQLFQRLAMPMSP
jgi:hypothetical protein